MTRTNLLWNVQDVSVQRWLLGRDFWRNWCLLESIACQLHLRHKIDTFFQRILTSNSQCSFLWDYVGFQNWELSRTNFSGTKRHKDPSETSQIAPFLSDEYQIISNNQILLMPGPRRNPTTPQPPRIQQGHELLFLVRGNVKGACLLATWGPNKDRTERLQDILGPRTNLGGFLPTKSGRPKQAHIPYTWTPCSSHDHSFHITNNFSLVMFFTSPWQQNTAGTKRLPLPSLPCWRCCLWVHGHELVVVGYFGFGLLLSPGIRRPGLPPNAVDVRGLILRGQLRKGI